MTVNIEKLRQDLRLDGRRFLLQAISAAAGMFAAGAVVAGAVIGLENYLHPSNPQPIFPPGTVITIPPAKP